jgi:hypothetical protein
LNLKFYLQNLKSLNRFEDLRMGSPFTILLHASSELCHFGNIYHFLAKIVATQDIVPYICLWAVQAYVRQMYIYVCGAKRVNTAKFSPIIFWSYYMISMSFSMTSRPHYLIHWSSSIIVWSSPIISRSSSVNEKFWLSLIELVYCQPVNVTIFFHTYFIN